jgi:hypothetical protein
METLNNAARAAGFAMAAPDDLPEESVPEAQPESNPWRSGDAVLLDQALGATPLKTGPSLLEWFRGVSGVFGRRAPALSRQPF